jgi:hypothetical protein
MFSSGAFSTAPFASESAINVDVSVTGLSSTSFIGNESVVIDVSFQVSGNLITSSVGDVIVLTPIDVTGVSASALVGSVSVLPKQT